MRLTQILYGPTKTVNALSPGIKILHPSKCKHTGVIQRYVHTAPLQSDSTNQAQVGAVMARNNERAYFDDVDTSDLNSVPQRPLTTDSLTAPCGVSQESAFSRPLLILIGAPIPPSRNTHLRPIPRQPDLSSSRPTNHTLWR
jgi:hypothetical protein